MGTGHTSQPAAESTVIRARITGNHKISINDATALQKYINNPANKYGVGKTYPYTISNEKEIIPDFNVPYLYSTETELTICPQAMFDGPLQIKGQSELGGLLQDGHKGFVISNIKSLPQKKQVKIASGKKVLFMGDSFTAHNIYPKYVYDTMTSIGKEITLLGTWGKGVYRHDGRSGWRNYTFAKCSNQRDDPALTNGASIPNPFYNPSKASFDFKYYVEKKLKGVSPDIVFVNLGTNDMTRGNHDSESELCSYIRTIVSSIKSYNPEIRVVYWLPCQFPIGEYAGYDRWQYISNYSKILIKHQKELGIDELCPVRYAFDCYQDGQYSIQTINGQETKKLTDRTHPSEQGYSHIAQMIIPYIHD